MWCANINISHLLPWTCPDSDGYAVGIQKNTLCQKRVLEDIIWAWCIIEFHQNLTCPHFWGGCPFPYISNGKRSRRKYHPDPGGSLLLKLGVSWRVTISLKDISPVEVVANRHHFCIKCGGETPFGWIQGPGMISGTVRHTGSFFTNHFNDPSQPTSIMECQPWVLKIGMMINPFTYQKSVLPGFPASPLRHFLWHRWQITSGWWEMSSKRWVTHGMWHDHYPPEV